MDNRLPDEFFRPTAHRGPWAHPPKPAPARNRGMFWTGCAFIGFALAVAAHVAIANPIGRAIADARISHQIVGVAE